MTLFLEKINYIILQLHIEKQKNKLLKIYFFLVLKKDNVIFEILRNGIKQENYFQIILKIIFGKN